MEVVYFRFDLSAIFSCKDNNTLQSFAILLHKQKLVPNTTEVLFIDKVNEESQRHAHGVSKDLKYALRRSIELLGNEVSTQLVKKRKASGQTAYKTREGESAIDNETLTRECLRFMYRIIFVFYIEARPELGFAPMKAESYRKGYSLESLRELELIHLQSEADENGYYFHLCITKLFDLLFKGTPDFELGADNEYDCDFVIRAVRAELFDPQLTPHINQVKIRNKVWQQIIKMMSLTKESKNRGRISYAQLGINQLGAVYESLLSYSGFFAATDRYEVKKAGDDVPDELDAAYFVDKEDLDSYSQNEIVKVYNESKEEYKVYKRDSFIYRLAGRDRENSASFYTPEILTQCLVKYSLKELLVDKSADQILDITICEPAMGSAAFLVEAVNQLADAYLERKQIKLGKRISPENLAIETQKVRAFITDRNTFGVDLNPIAVELGQVSLWLNCIHKGDFVPWFGNQLFAGNSLIGARCEVYPARTLEFGTRKEENWHNCVPRATTKKFPRKEDEIYHFLLPDYGMSKYNAKMVNTYFSNELEFMNKWRKEFSEPLNSEEIFQLKTLSAVIDKLFEENANNLRKERAEIADSIEIYGRSFTKIKSTDFIEKNRKLDDRRGVEAKNSPP